MIVDATLLLGVLLAVLTGLYVFRDQEREELTDVVRKSVKGSFIKLQDGFVHYDIAGPVDGPVVVLVHGFSTWSFTWDATFQALVPRCRTSPVRISPPRWPRSSGRTSASGRAASRG